MEAVTAFVLAGGKSARMGFDKAFLTLAGKPLIQHALDLAGEISAKVSIVGDPAKLRDFGEVVADICPSRGPLGGVHAAVLSSKTDYNLLLAVDLPFLTTGFLNYLVESAQSAGAVVTVPWAAGHFHPLCAVYRKEFGGIAERALAAGHNKLDALFPDVSLRVIREDELTAAGFDASIFRNLNTPEEWELAKNQFVRP